MMSVKEFILGGQKEKEARHTLTALGQKDRLTRKQERTLTDANKTLKQLVVRRVGLAATVATLALASPVVLRQRDVEESVPPIYQGNLSLIQGRRLIREEEFSSLTSALEQTSNPFMQKIARDLTRLHREENNHPDLPAWINEDSSPLPITRDSSGFSHAVSEIDWLDYSTVPHRWSPMGTNQIVNGKDFTALSMGIHLGLRPEDESSEPLIKAFFLAKEHMSHMIDLRMALEWGQINEKYRLENITDPEGRSITDRVTLDRIGPSVYYSYGGHYESIPGRVADASPTLFLGQALLDLENKGEIESNPKGLGYFVESGILLDEDRQNAGQVYKITQDMIDNWVTQDSLLPPAGMTQRLISEPMISAIDKVAQQMWPQGTPTP